MPQSAELGGGAGFTYEGDVAAYYLAAMLDEAQAPGIADRIVVRVAVQQREMGEPLDDVVVDFRDKFGELARLSIQVKRALTISKAKSNDDFREIIRDSRDTLAKQDFRLGVDHYGAAVGTIGSDKFRAVNELSEIARASPTAAEFDQRFGPSGNAPVETKLVRRDIIALLDEFSGGPCSADYVHRFLSHFLIIQFDFLHPGATEPSEAINRIRDSLQPSDSGNASLVWSRLVEWARAGAGRSEQFDRPTLVRRLAPLVRLRGAASLRADLEKLTALARSYADKIQDDVGGERLGRDELAAQLDQKLAAGRLVQIRGLPGAGKSVLLRKSVERSLERGPVLFFKADQLEGKSWNSFAASHGLSGGPLETLLIEISATGTPVLYVDAIDRIDKEHQPVFLDVVGAIIKSARLDNWRILVTLRDSGIELLRNWLSDLLDAVQVRTVEVGELSNEEAQALAAAKPHLRPLLFGPVDVRKIVRRPFFAKILDQSFVTDRSGAPFTPQSEIDLVANWWKRGGYNSSGQQAIERQRAIVELARVRARQMSLPIRYAQLSSTSQISSLIEDGILQEARAGHSAHFAHDIFFEWSFLHALVDRDDQWLEEIRSAGEPPAIARVVELLSQSAYAEGPTWTQSLAATEATNLRAQWMRAWLVGPLGSPVFEKDTSRFQSAAFASDFILLRKVLVWFQAEKTTPNTMILLAEHVSPDQRQRLADYMGWPSDFPAWRRLITFLLDRIADIPVRLFPDVVSVFEVWQNAYANYANPLSTRLLTQCADWLLELDDIASETKLIRSSERWQPLPDFDDFRTSLVRLILKAAGSDPDPVTQFLQRKIADERFVREKSFAEAILFSSTLAKTHPQLLVNLISGQLREQLPEDKVMRERAEAKAAAERREALLAKPASERTPLENRVLGASSMGRLGHDFSHHDWDALCIERTYEPFSPPSPLREPFHSLFQFAPAEALRLLKELSNHAITAWRQLHRYSYDNKGTPIPLELEFPWGKQQFWGDEREYLWSRGMWAPDPVACGFLALENWCFDQLATGAPLDDLLKQIIEGHECVAILGTAVALALETNALSDVVLPLVGSQRLWTADRRRFGQDLGSGFAGLIGFTKPIDLPHVDAIKAINSRSIRKKQLCWLAQRYVVLGGGALSERARNAIASFKDNLPYLYEEWRNVPEAREQLLAEALEYGEVADSSTYKAYRASEDSDNIVVVHESPTAAKPENVVKVERAHLSLQESAVRTWVTKSFESGQLSENIATRAAIDLAKRVDSTTLFDDVENTEADADDDIRLGMRRGTVAGTASIVLSFRDGLSASDLEWARSILRRAYRAPQKKDLMWSAQSAIPWHEAISVARGLAADIRVGTAVAGAAEQLLGLVGHPLDVVSLAALEECCGLWSVDPQLSWASIYATFALCDSKPRAEGAIRGPSDAVHSPADVREVFDRANAIYRSPDWGTLPELPPAWVKIDPNSPSGRRPRGYRDDDHDYPEHDLGRPEDVWGEPEGYWYSQYAAKLLPRLPLTHILESDAKSVFLDFAAKLLDYTSQKNSPPWVKSGRRDRSSSRLYEWTHELGRFLGRLAGHLPLTEFGARFLDPVLALESDNCWAMLSPFASTYVCAYVYDAEQVPADAVAILQLCLERLLASSVFDATSYRAGELSGFDQPQLVETLMFVSVEHAGGAARYVNGDWRELGRILPIVDRFVRAAGWSSNVMGRFLTLCERAKSDYPAEAFADQVLAVLQDQARPLKRWHGTFVPARIAELVQHFADRDSPLPLPTAHKFLRILDVLVDMGDRRSAALQLGEAFREIRVGS